MELNIIILAGGEGSRLWPLVHEGRPKPFLKIDGYKTLLEETIDRFSSLGKIFIVISKKHVEQAKKIIPENGVEYIEELSSVGTGVAMRLAAEQFLGKELLLFTHADQLIENPDHLLSSIIAAKQYAMNGDIVLFGTKPTSANEHFGYVCFGQDGKVNSFIEKPTVEEAEKLVKEPNVMWNMGICLMRADKLIEEWETHFNPNELNIEKGIWVKASNLRAIPVNSPFTDLGTFETISKYFVARSKNHIGNATNSFIYSDDLPIKTEGVDDMIIVASKHGLLIRKKAKDPS